MKRVRRLSLMVTASTGVVMLVVLLGASRGTEGTPVRHEAPASYGQTSTLLPDGRWVFVGGTQGHAPQASAVLWDPVRNTLTPTWRAPQFARAGHTATVLPDGTVFVLGGIGGSGEIVATAELFTPATQTFTPFVTPSLMPRAFHSATLLTDGRVLIAGSRAATDEVLSTADVWDPRTLASEVVPGALQYAREEHVATLLPDGSVWLSGGRGADGRLVRDNERYIPTSQVFTLSESLQTALSPTVVMQSLPPAGAAEVPLDGRIALRLSRPVDVTTVTPETVQLTYAAGAVATSVTAAEDGRLVFVTPVAPATVYTLTVNGVTDETGATLPFAEFSFTTTGAPGAKFDFWQYDPEGIGWKVYGLGTVTADGTQIVPDAGVRIYEFTGAMINGGGSPPPPGPPPDGGPGTPPGGGPTPGGPGPNPSPGPSPGPGPGPNPGPGPKPSPGPDSDSPPEPSLNPNPSPAPNPEPAPGEPTDGEPISLNTGLFIFSKTDVVLPDVMPIVLTRVYRTNDSNTRPFGIGTTHPYAMFLWSANQYQEVDLILPDGGRIHYVRTSPGITATSAVFEHTATQTAFYKSKITWNGRGWDLTLTDGTVYVFGENAPLQSIRDRYGNLIALTRASTNDYGSQTGNILQLTTSNGRWLAFTYDAQNRITQARDNL